MMVYVGDADGDSSSSALTSGAWDQAARRLGRLERWESRGLAKFRRRVPRTHPRHQVSGQERGRARAELGSAQLPHARRPVAAALGRTGVDLSKRQQGSRAGEAQVRFRVQRRTSCARRCLSSVYAETLELGRVKGQAKVEEYYRIIRKESERLTALINNILDFSRIEAGRKEHEFRHTDVAELVSNTLDTYRDQIDEQGFTFEQRIDSDIPPCPWTARRLRARSSTWSTTR